MSETRAISTTPRCELSSSFFFPARQGVEGNSRHSDRNISTLVNEDCDKKTVKHMVLHVWAVQFLLKVNLLI